MIIYVNISMNIHLNIHRNIHMNIYMNIHFNVKRGRERFYYLNSYIIGNNSLLILLKFVDKKLFEYLHSIKDAYMVFTYLDEHIDLYEDNLDETSYNERLD